MATNYAVASNQRKTINEQLDEFFGKGNEVKQLGFSMSNRPMPLVLDGKKEYCPTKKPPTFNRCNHG